MGKTFKSECPKIYAVRQLQLIRMSKTQWLNFKNQTKCLVGFFDLKNEIPLDGTSQIKSNT